MNNNKILIYSICLINLLWFPFDYILLIIYHYELSHVPIIGIDILILWYFIASGKLERDD